MTKPKTRVSANPNPMVDNDTIQDAIDRSGYSMMQFAEMIGMCYHTLRHRLDDGNWSVLEAYKVCRELGLDFTEIFLAHPEKIQ